MGRRSPFPREAGLSGVLLVLRIRALARRKPAAHGRVLRAAGIDLDPVKRTATRDGRPLDLSAKELGVLEALLRASPGALSAEQLLEQVWDENTDPFTRTVHVTIARLRRKLGHPRPIHNTPGIGYRIAETKTLDPALRTVEAGRLNSPKTRHALRCPPTSRRLAIRSDETLAIGPEACVGPVLLLRGAALCPRRHQAPPTVPRQNSP